MHFSFCFPNETTILKTGGIHTMVLPCHLGTECLCSTKREIRHTSIRRYQGFINTCSRRIYYKSSHTFPLSSIIISPYNLSLGGLPSGFEPHVSRLTCMHFFSRPRLLLGVTISYFQIRPLQYFMHTTYYSVELFHLQLSVASALLSTYPTQHPVFTHSKTVS